MGVDVESDGHGGVTKALTNYLGVHAGLEGEGGVSVAQVMKTDSWQPDAA
jgi:hypothetical protein